MSHDSYVCGFIKLGNADKALSAIGLLPANAGEDDWPYLTSAMFSGKRGSLPHLWGRWIAHRHSYDDNSLHTH